MSMNAAGAENTLYIEGKRKRHRLCACPEKR